MIFKRAPLIAYFCILPILLALGLWQLNRAEEKRVAIRLQEQRQSTNAFVLTASTLDELEALLYKPIQAFGHFDVSHQYLLDNQINNGKAGYFVLTPFFLKDANKAVLVNRGWIPLGNNRADLPDTNGIDKSEISITGRVNRFQNVGIKLAGAEIPSQGWPSVVQVVDVNALSKRLGYPLFSFQVELDKNAKDGYVRDWHEALVMTPEKHIGYAVQWFLLALTLTVLFVKYGIKKS